MPTLRNFDLLGSITYGPVVSRRLGKSLGVNILPPGQKICSFRCGYCQLGDTPRPAELVAEAAGMPTAEQVVEAVRRALENPEVKTDWITLSGNGEPTAHPDFEGIIQGLIGLRDKLAPQVWIAVLTNGAHLHRAEVLRAIERVDLAMVKLDAGTEAAFRALNHPPSWLTLKDLVEGIRQIKEVTIQSLFVTGSVDNSTDEEVREWLRRLEEISPAAVQVYTLDRVPADNTLQPISGAKLQEIALRAKELKGVKVVVAERG